MDHDAGSIHYHVGFVYVLAVKSHPDEVREVEEYVAWKGCQNEGLDDVGDLRLLPYRDAYLFTEERDNYQKPNESTKIHQSLDKE